MKQMMKLGWIVAFVTAMALLFAGCPTRPDEYIPRGDGEVVIFGNGAFIPGATIVPHEDGGPLATITGGNIVAQWNDEFRINIELYPPVDISDFTDFEMSWNTVPPLGDGGGASFNIRLLFTSTTNPAAGEREYGQLMLSNWVEADASFDFVRDRPGWATDWTDAFAETSQQLTGLEIYSIHDDIANRVLNISRIAIVGGEVTEPDVLTVTIGTTTVNANLRGTAHASVNEAGNIIWNSAAEARAIYIDFDPPSDISDFSEFVMNWATPPGEPETTFNVRLDFVTGGASHLQNMVPRNNATFHFEEDWVDWGGQQFVNTSMQLASIQIFDDSGIDGTITISNIRIQGEQLNGSGVTPPPPAGTTLTIDVDGTSVDATIAESSRAVAGVDDDGNLIVNWNPEGNGEFRVNVDLDDPADITGMSGFVMDWTTGGASGGFVITLRFSDDGSVSLANWGTPSGRATFDFETHFEDWGDAFTDVSLDQFTGFEIFGNTQGNGVLTISEIAFAAGEDNDDDGVTIFADGTLASGASLVQYGGTMRARLESGNIVSDWDGDFRVNIELATPVDLTGFSNFVMNWTGAAYGNFNISLDFTEGSTLLVSWIQAGDASFDLVEARPSWATSVTGFENSSKQLTRIEIFSDDGSNFANTTLTISGISFQ